MIQKRNSIVLALIAMLLVSACASTRLDFERQGFIYADVYQGEYYDVMDTLTDPNATDAQKEVALQKKNILRRLWPMLKVYDDMIRKGEVPPDQLVLDITGLIKELTGEDSTWNQSQLQRH